MTTKAEREAAYQALVKLGVPIPPNEIDAVLEAAEGARGVAVETEIGRLRERLREARTLLLDIRLYGRRLTYGVEDWFPRRDAFIATFRKETA